jgi:hypothetical protein
MPKGLQKPEFSSRIHDRMLGAGITLHAKGPNPRLALCPVRCSIGEIFSGFLRINLGSGLRLALEPIQLPHRRSRQHWSTSADLR